MWKKLRTIHNTNTYDVHVYLIPANGGKKYTVIYQQRAYNERLAASENGRRKKSGKLTEKARSNTFHEFISFRRRRRHWRQWRRCICEPSENVWWKYLLPPLLLVPPANGFSSFFCIIRLIFIHDLVFASSSLEFVFGRKDKLKGRKLNGDGNSSWGNFRQSTGGLFLLCWAVGLTLQKSNLSLHPSPLFPLAVRERNS